MWLDVCQYPDGWSRKDAILTMKIGNRFEALSIISLTITFRTLAHILCMMYEVMKGFLLSFFVGPDNEADTRRLSKSASTQLTVWCLDLKTILYNILMLCRYFFQGSINSSCQAERENNSKKNEKRTQCSKNCSSVEWKRKYIIVECTRSNYVKLLYESMRETNCSSRLNKIG